VPLIGSSAKSSSTPTSQNSAFSEIGGNASSLNLNLVGGKRSANTINVLDGGAINSAFAFANESMRQVELAGGRASAEVSAAIKAVSENARSDSENFGSQAIKWGAIVAVVIALAWAARKAKG
jgi:hypothetical protein